MEFIFEYIVFEIADELCNNDDIYALAGGNEWRLKIMYHVYS